MELPSDPAEIAVVIDTQGLLLGEGRICSFMGLLIVADFDLTAETLAPFVPDIFRQLERQEKRLAAGEIEKIEVGIYDNQVRVWGVHGA